MSCFFQACIDNHGSLVGVSAIIHVATDFPSNPNPHEAVPRTVGGVVNALEAAAKEPSVKRFVLTSSSTAALIPKPDNPKTVTAETWNDEAIKSAYRPPPYEPGRAHAVYAAGKTLGEKEAWKFVHERKPAFTVNAGEMRSLLFFPFFPLSTCPLFHFVAINTFVMLMGISCSPAQHGLWGESRSCPSGPPFHLQLHRRILQRKLDDVGSHAGG